MAKKQCMTESERKAKILDLKDELKKLQDQQSEIDNIAAVEMLKNSIGKVFETEHKGAYIIPYSVDGDKNSPTCGLVGVFRVTDKSVSKDNEFCYAEHFDDYCTISNRVSLMETLEKIESSARELRRLLG